MLRKLHFVIPAEAEIQRVGLAPPIHSYFSHSTHTPIDTPNIIDIASNTSMLS